MATNIGRKAFASKPLPRLGYREYCSLPADGLRHEIIDGSHFMTPAPSTRHQTVSKRLQYQIYTQVELAGLGVVFSAPVDVQFSDHDIVQPDLVVVLAEHSERITPTKLNGPPDLIVEILSPSTASTDLTLKKQLYERAGVPEYWIADSDTKTIDQYILQGDRYNRAPAANPITTLANQLTIHHADIW